MRAMVERGEVDALVAERVWQETEKALREPKAGEFFKVLRECGALQVDLSRKSTRCSACRSRRNGTPRSTRGVHTLMVLDQAARLSAEPKVRFAALVHDLGKGTTPRAEWPGHRGHEERSVALIESLSARLRLPAEYRDLAIIVARYHGNVHRAFELRPGTILEILEKSDAFRRPERFAQALLACEADSRGRLGLDTRPYPQREYLQAARDAAAVIKPTPQEIAEQDGARIAEQMRQRRTRAIVELAGRVKPRDDV